MSFNRKLNEERKKRLTYIDSQTGVAQRNYNSERHKRERMPGIKLGQVYSYPQKRWRKKKYQYLDRFMQPARPLPFNSEAYSISQLENPSSGPGPGGLAGPGALLNGTSTASIGSLPSSMTAINDDSNGSPHVQEPITNGTSKDDSKWSYYDDDEAFLDDFENENNSDSDYDYGDSYGARKKKSKGGKGSRGGKGGGGRR